jgi:aryl-alcohol dehydrogenase-like predicted oxidoreductase
MAGMEYSRLGRSGLEVSRLVLGCMSFGLAQPSGAGVQHGWTLGEEDSRAIIRQALEAGINMFDTANTYAGGASEEIVGRALRDFARRDEVVLATKVCGRTRPGPNGRGLSRKAVFDAIDASLKRLGTDYIDLYQIHRFDPATPVEETLEALHDLVRAGKVRYLGASSMATWQFAKLVYTARQHGWASFVCMQNHLNLLYREEEREMLPFCVDQGIGVTPWSPLARGRLARAPDQVTARLESDAVGRNLYSEAALDAGVIDAVGMVAAARGVRRAQVALAWLLQKNGVTGPVIGATGPGHLDDALAALALRLDAAEIAVLESPYLPHRVAGFN